MRIVLDVNGERYELDVAPARRLVSVLRDDLQLTGTKLGCSEGACGTCAVLLDGRVVASCLLSVAAVEGHAVVTIEGIGTRERPHPLQQSFLDEQAGQCGYCLPGIIVTAKALLDRNPSPSRAEIALALDDNICRCGSHARILRAVERAAAMMRGEDRQ